MGADIVNQAMSMGSMHGNADRTGAGLYQPQQGTELCGYLLRQWIYGNKFQAACIYPPDERCAAEENQVYRGERLLCDNRTKSERP